MAERAERKDLDDDLAILFPDMHATIAGVPVVMREYRWSEGLRLQSLVGPIVEKLADLAMNDRLAQVVELEALFADQADNLPLLIGMACDQSAEWVAGLSDEDGAKLRTIWWTVNVPFFARRVQARLQTLALTQLGGPTSAPSSSTPDTAPISSNTTRAVN